MDLLWEVVIGDQLHSQNMLDFLKSHEIQSFFRFLKDLCPSLHNNHANDQLQQTMPIPLAVGLFREKLCKMPRKTMTPACMWLYNISIFFVCLMYCCCDNLLFIVCFSFLFYGCCDSIGMLTQIF